MKKAAKEQKQRDPFQALPYYKPQLGKDYWIKDNILPNALEVAERCYNRQDWILGFPHRNETWPGMRVPGGLLPNELEIVENWVKETTNTKKLWQVAVPGDGALSHNYVQLVGEQESGPRPHTDSRKLCRYAAVIYLSPQPQAFGGTSFFRLRFPNGTLGGNTCPAPYANLREALNIKGLPLNAWQQDLSVSNVFNRMLLYRANLVHSATAYFGREHRDKRMTVVFFWMAE